MNKTPFVKPLFATALAIALLGGASAQAQTVLEEDWTAGSDFYTNADWNPSLTGSTLYPNNNDGTGNNYTVVITNGGTCYYSGTPGGDPVWTNTIGKLLMGGTANGVGGSSNPDGSVSNVFIMSGGSLTLTNPTAGGFDFAIGGNSTGSTSLPSTNYFTLTGGTLDSEAPSTTNWVGLAKNSVSTAEFDGGMATLNNLMIGGRGVGTVTINGANVKVDQTLGLGMIAGAVSTVNLESGTLTVTNSEFVLNNGNIASLNCTINISGGTLNVNRLQYGTGSTASGNNTVNFSGGTINFGPTGYGRNGTHPVNSFIMSGGTISCLPGDSPVLSGLINTVLTNVPGPGVVTFAPLAGQSITVPGTILGPGALITAGPGTTILLGGVTFTGGLTNSGGTLAIDGAETQSIGLTNTGGNLEIDAKAASTTATNIGSLVDSPIVMPALSSLVFSNITVLPYTNGGGDVFSNTPPNLPIPFTNNVNGAGNLLVGDYTTVTNTGNLQNTGSTTIGLGNLVLTGSGSIASATTTINSGGTLDASALSSFSLGSGQTLVGDGTVIGPAGGNVNFNGGSTLSVGFPGGTYTLAMSNNLVFNSGSTNSVVVNRTTIIVGNDEVTGLHSVTLGGTLVITNMGTSSFIPGDAIPLFSAVTYVTNGFTAANIVPATPGSGLVWDLSTLGSDGTLRVALAVANPNAPHITTQPITTTVNQGVAFTNTVVAAGSATLAYQWYEYPSGAAISGQTSSNLVLNPVQLINATNYCVVVTNSIGSVVSSVVSLGVNSAPIIISQFPNTFTNVLWAGASPVFSVYAGGASPLYYQWVTNGVMVVGATNTSYMRTNVQAGAFTNYCIVTNIVGSVTSAVWRTSVIADPTNLYPATVLSNNPVAYWRLDETNNGTGNAGVIAHDYWGGHNAAYYNNVVLGEPGYNPKKDTNTAAGFGLLALSNSYAGEISNPTGLGSIDFSQPNGNSAEFSIEAWVNSTNATQINGAAIVAKGYGNGGEQFDLDMFGGFRFIVRNYAGTVHATAPTTTPAVGAWYHVVAVCDGSNGVLRVYVNGVDTSDQTITAGDGLLYTSGDTVLPAANYVSIGARASSLTANNFDLQFQGIIDDVAIYNYALSSNQVMAHYQAANLAPEILTQYPVTYTNVMTLFAGVSPTFSISAAGDSPLYYQWVTNGVMVPGATNATYVLPNVQAGMITNYCILTNFVGSTTSTVWTASVIADPTNLYPRLVLSNNPVGYWRLNEPDDGYSDGNPGAICLDYAGGNDGIYTNVYLANADGGTGYSPTTDPEPSAQFGEYGFSIPPKNNDAAQIQGIDFAAPGGSNVNFSVETWVNGFPNAQVSAGTVISKGIYNNNNAFAIDVDTTANHYFRFYVRTASNVVVTATSTIKSDNNWHHMVGVCDESDGVVKFYIDGMMAASAAITAGSGLIENSLPISIGAGTDNATNNYDLQFYGYLNDVAIYNYALSSNQVVVQYASGGVPPFFTQKPATSVNVNAGSTLTIPAAALGTAPVTYQWFTNSVLFGGQTNATLTVSNVSGALNGSSLYLSVTDPYGVTNSAAIALTVYTNAPLIIQDLLPHLVLVSGHSYTYSIGVVGPMPYGYQWYNVASKVANQTNSTYTVTAGSPGTSTTYYVVITNVYGVTTSTVSTFTSIAQLTNSFATNLLQLQPVGYWPMHEVEPPAPGDIETNYGSLGFLGTGYYADWVSPGGPAGLQFGFPGALANDPDTAVYFPGDSGFTNCMSIPHTSPLATLNPPFSVECWFYPSNDVTGDVWSQCGYEGLNAGGYGGGAGSIAGIRLFWNGPTFYLYTYYTASTLHQVGHIHELPGSWYHLVVTCDADTNMMLYLDGVPAFTNAQAGLYTPDYWSPLALANGKGYLNAQPGIMDEFAIYTNVLSALDITNHYSDGVNESQAGVYVADVTNDNPVIYLRMDASVYTAPAIAVWPVLTNYGSAGGSGVYTPGTAPGIVPGPNLNGAPFKGLSGTKVAHLSGVSSFADAGYATAYDPVGPVPFTLTAMFRGNPCDPRTQTIVGHTTSSWRLWMNTSGKLEWQVFATNATYTVISAGTYNDGNWHQAVAVYTPASDPSVTGTNSLYVDGLLDSITTGVSTNGFGPGSPMDVMIGADSQYTNKPAGLGQQFAGQVCEVALFTNALNSAQVQAIYNATAPAAPTISSVTLSGNNLVITYTGVLYSSANVTGPYNNMITNASPYITPATNAQMFYRASSQ